MADKKGGSWVDQEERVVKQVAAEIVDETNKLSEAVGDRKYGQRQRSEREQAKQSGLLWDAPPEVWAAMLDQYGDKAVKEMADRYVRLRAKYPDEASYIPPRPNGGLPPQPPVTQPVPESLSNAQPAQAAPVAPPVAPPEVLPQ